MRTTIGLLVVLVGGLGATALGRPADEADLRVLPEEVNGVRPRDMMNRYLRGLVAERREAWERDFAQLQTAVDIRAEQDRKRAAFRELLGPFPDRTPLVPRVTGQIERDGYRVERIVFESQPRHFVTGALYVPDPVVYPPPYPGVLVPCGHSSNGKAYDAYQRASALLAQNGLVAFCIDPIDQGERYQWLDDDGSPRIGGTHGHTMIGVGSILLGRNTATYEVWDAMRAIDYLQSRPEVDPQRIGCMGNSGGGTQTAYLAALDDRVQAASPSCYITSFSRLVETIGVQDAEQNVFGQLAHGVDHADYLTMRAPIPILVVAATRDFFDIEGTWDSFRHAKRLYTRLGYAERIEIIEDDKPHNYDRTAREAAVRWMTRWLAGRDAAIREGEIEVLTEEEIRCTPTGQVMQIEGARSVYDLNRELAAELRAGRASRGDDPSSSRLDRIRAIAGVRRLHLLPEPVVGGAGFVEADGHRIEKLVIRPEPGIWLPALLYVPPVVTGAALYVDERGKAAGAEPGGAIETLLAAGRTVLAVDLRGTGETRQTEQGYFKPHFGSDGQDVYTAYVLGRSYVGMRAEDILVCARWLGEHVGRGGVHLVSAGNVGVPALHAAALEPQLFASADVRDGLASWDDLVEHGWTENQLVNAVHGALREYDLPDLRTRVDRLRDRAGVTFHRADGAMGVALDGPFTMLRHGDVQKPYLYPLIAPNWARVTRGYPMDPRPSEAMDHPHHTSVWFAHGDVNGHDFWHGPEGEQIVCVAPPETDAAAGTLTARFEWRDGAGAVVCVEDRVMRFSGDAHRRMIDFDMTIHAVDGDVAFGDTKEGTFAIRLAPTLRLEGEVAGGHYLSSEGHRDGDCWGQRAAWMAGGGPVGDRTVGVAILDHPENPNHPTWWHARDYGLFAANPFGAHDFDGKPNGAGAFTVPDGESLRFRYRVLIGDAAWERETLDAAFTSFAR